MRELSGALVILAGAIVFAASIVSSSFGPSREPNILAYVGFLAAGLLAIFGGVLILSADPKPGNRP
jgi:hypothetical protein